MRRLTLLSLCLGAGITGCSGVGEDVTIEFTSPGALEHTNVLSLTAFEPFVRDEESDALQFVGCDRVGAFPPNRDVNPDTIAVSNLVGRVLRDRESETYPIDGDWSVAFDLPDPGNESNPWGAMMVYIEARGDARASERGAGQVAATLLSGCYCVRTRDGGPSDPALTDLDRAVRKDCDLLGAEDAPDERVVALAAVTSPEFHLTATDGIQNLTSPKNSVITPGPKVTLEADDCNDVVVPQDCFRCETQSCTELDDISNAPILFEVRQPGGSSTPLSQVVLTDERGNASATIEVDDCSAPISVTAHVVGRPEESVTFDVACVDDSAEFECIDESPLAPGFEAVAIATVPGEPDACSPSNPEACDHVAVLYENGTDSLLQVRSPLSSRAAEMSFPGLRAHAVLGFDYDAGSGTTPAVAVVLANPDLAARVYVYRWQDGQLVAHDGADGVMTGSCPWFDSCHSNNACDAQTPCTNMAEGCEGDRCRIRQGCWPRIQLQSRVTIDTRDIDLDGRADLAIGNSGEVPVMFFYSGAAPTDAMFASDGCACGRFNQAPNAFTLANMGGAAPNPMITDIVLGSAGGSYLKYALPTMGGPSLTCGQAAPLGDGMSVRDVKGARLSCRADDLSCSAYDDAVIVSARGISGGSLDEPGFIRVLYGTSNDLSLGGDVLDIPGISLGLVPRAFPDRGEPRDPRNAQVADFNADGHQDLAVLYKASEEVHIWLGASNRSLGEIERGVVLEECAVSLEPASRCAPLPSIAAPDLDGDGRAEVAVICDPMGAQPRVRYFKTRTN